MRRRIQDNIGKIYSTYKWIKPNNKTIRLGYEAKRKLQYRPLQEISEYQTRCLRDLLRKAKQAPYYGSILHSLDVEKLQLQDLRKVPFLTKDIIRANKADLLTTKSSLLLPNSSGGSTGEPLNFFQDRHFWEERDASLRISWETANWSTGARVVMLWGAPQDKREVEGPLGRLRLYLKNTRYHDTFDLSESQLFEVHRSCSQFRPHIIQGYATSLYLLARFLKSQNLKPVYPSRSIISSAETLHDHMRKTIEEVFGVKVFDRYGSREVGALASECEAHNGLHVHMYDEVVECIDMRTGRQVWDEPGEIIVTCLHNWGMPFLRYRIGDLGVLSREQCKCGRNLTLLKKLMGRTTDNFVTNDGKIIHGEYFTHLFYGIEGVREFQFIQHSSESYELVIGGANKDRINVEELKNKIYEIVGTNSDLTVKFVATIPKTPTGKFRFTVSEVTAPF